VVLYRHHRLVLLSAWFLEYVDVKGHPNLDFVYIIVTYYEDDTFKEQIVSKKYIH
jgi:hypothetical protein